MQSYGGFTGIAIEPILGDQIAFDKLFKAYSKRREFAKTFATKTPLWIDEMCFRDFAKTFRRKPQKFSVFNNLHPGEFVQFQGAISNVPGKRKTESKKSIFLSVQEM